MPPPSRPAAPRTGPRPPPRFDRALDDAGLAGPALRGVLQDYFAWATTHSMAVHPENADEVPVDLHIPH